MRNRVFSGAFKRVAMVVCTFEKSSCLRFSKGQKASKMVPFGFFTVRIVLES